MQSTAKIQDEGKGILKLPIKYRLSVGLSTG
jgi:hypothetical protein